MLAGSCGVDVAELMGSHPRIFRSGVHDDAFYVPKEMFERWAALEQGEVQQ